MLCLHTGLTNRVGSSSSSLFPPPPEINQHRLKAQIAAWEAEMQKLEVEEGPGGKKAMARLRAADVRPRKPRADGRF